jgi:hypothetical protein
VEDEKPADRPEVGERAVPHLSEEELLAWRGLLELEARVLAVLDAELVAGLQAAAAAQRGRDGDVAAGGQGDHAAGVAAPGYHARVGGERQPVAAGPAQRGDDGPLADPARGVDAGDPVHDVLRR